MRVVWGVAVAALVCGLGAVQVVGGVALRERARPGAWMTFVTADAAGAVDRLDARVPLPWALRLVLARDALARGDDALAARHASALGTSPDTLALAAALAARRGDDATAMRDDLAAGDAAALDARIARLIARDRIGDARALAVATVARLREDRTADDVLARALLRLGDVEELRAVVGGTPARERAPDARRALAAYQEAASLAPFSVAFALAVGNQFLNLGDLAAAGRAFERARAIDPTSAEPLTGLGDVAARRGDRTAARAYLARARVLDARSAAVARLAAKLAR